MTLKTIKAGAQPNDGTGDNLRSGAQIINENFAELDQRAARASAQLSSIETGATKNRPDAELLARANHTGAQPASTISDFSPAVKAILQQYGLAEKIRDIPEGQLNGLSVNTFTFCRPAGAGILPSQVNHYVIHLQLNDAGFAMQIAVNFLSGKSYSRIKDNGNWQAQWAAGITKGDYGVGAKDDAPFVGVNQNPDTYLTGGYAVGQFTILGTSLTGVLITQAGSNSTAAAQQFVDWATGKMFTRGKSSNTWSAWRSVVSGGEFGIGGNAPAAPGTSLNTVTPSGMYAWANTYEGAPGIAQGEVITMMASQNYGCQMAGSHETDELWFRRKTASWQGWKPIVMNNTYLSRNKAGGAALITDLNSLTSRNTLWVDGTVINAPYPNDWYVEILALEEGGSFGGYVMQRATNINNGSFTFVRTRVAGTWSAWIRQTPEYVNNANGNAIKFSDGTMIAYAEGAVTTATTPVGSLFSSGHAAFTFPVTFSTRPTVAPTTTDREGVDNIPFLGGVNNTNVYVGFYSPANTGKCRPGYIAIGRWK